MSGCRLDHLDWAMMVLYMVTSNIAMGMQLSHAKSSMGRPMERLVTKWRQSLKSSSHQWGWECHSLVKATIHKK